MTIGEWLHSATKDLQKADIPTARLDAEVLLADAVGKDRSWLHAHLDKPIASVCSGSNPEQNHLEQNLEQLNGQMEQRAGHEPLAYVRGKQEFYGRDFYVSPDTLTPRPETETMVELLVEQLRKREAAEDKATVHSSPSTVNIVDIGTGSGCIIVTAALELSKLETLNSKLSLIGLDISEKALKIARKNAQKHEVKVNFRRFDLLHDDLPSILNSRFSILLCNLPYVPTDFKINLAASHEPEFAIYGGVDGLDYYQALFEQLRKKEKGKRKKGAAATPNSRLESLDSLVFTESLPPQHKKLQKIAQTAGFKQIQSQDFVQVFVR